VDWQAAAARAAAARAAEKAAAEWVAATEGYSAIRKLSEHP